LQFFNVEGELLVFQNNIRNYYDRKERGVSHCGIAIYIKKYLKPNEGLWKLKDFTMQKYDLQKVLKKNKNPSRYYN
jgi:hypothetical protein